MNTLRLFVPQIRVKIRTITLSVLACALLISCETAQVQTKSSQHSNPLAKTAPTQVEMSSERLGRIGSMIDSAIKDGQIPGAVALVARNGKIVYLEAFGMSDNETGRTFKSDDIFRIASQTKAITSTAVMQLWEQGLFKLDDPISNWIPEFKDVGVLKEFNEDEMTWTTDPVDEPITIRHLLTHTSGIGYGVIDEDPRIRKIYDHA